MKLAAHALTMRHILLLSDRPEQVMILAEALGREDVVIAREAGVPEPDLIVVIARRADAGKLETIRRLMKERPVPVVMFVDEGDEDTAAAATEAGVSAFVIDGLRKERIRPILRAAEARFQKMQGLRRELEKVRSDLKDRKLVERAKGLLMKQRGCDEEEAYAALRTLAMKQNKRLGEIAESVINAAALLK